MDIYMSGEHVPIMNVYGYEDRNANGSSTYEDGYSGWPKWQMCIRAIS